MYVVLEKTNPDGSITRTVMGANDPHLEVMTSGSWRLHSRHDCEKAANKAATVPVHTAFTAASLCPYIRETGRPIRAPGNMRANAKPVAAEPAAPRLDYAPSGGIGAPHGARPTGVWNRLSMPAPRRHNPEQWWVLSVSKAGNITSLRPVRGKTLQQAQCNVGVASTPAELYGVYNHPQYGFIVGRAYATECGIVLCQSLHPEWAVKAALDARGEPAGRTRGGLHTPKTLWGKFVRCDPERVPETLIKRPRRKKPQRFKD